MNNNISMKYSKSNNITEEVIIKYNKDLQYLALSLTGSKPLADNLINSAANLIAISGESLPDDRLTVRKKCAGLFMKNLLINSEPLSGNIKQFAEKPEDSIFIPENGLKNYDFLIRAEELIYFGTSKEELHIFFLYEFAGLDEQEISEIYGTDISVIRYYLYNSVNKIKTSMNTLMQPDDKLIKISLKDLLEAAAVKKPPKKKTAGTKGKFRLDKKNIMIISAALLLAVSFIVFQVLVIAANKNPDEYPMNDNFYNYHEKPYYPYYHPDEPLEESSEETLSHNSLVLKLLCDTPDLDMETVAFVNEDFASKAENVTYIQVLAINSGSGTITPDDLEVSFSDGSKNLKDGKKCFIYEIYPIDKHTNLIQIFAPGFYMPEQFRIDMYWYGTYEKSYMLPSKITDAEDVEGNLIHYSISGDEIHNVSSGDVIKISPDGRNAIYLYIINAKQVSESEIEYSEGCFKTAVKLRMLPVGTFLGDLPDERYPDNTRFGFNIETAAADADVDFSDNYTYLHTSASERSLELRAAYNLDLKFKEKDYKHSDKTEKIKEAISNANFYYIAANSNEVNYEIKISE